MGYTGHHSQHAAETVEEWHRNAEPVLFGELHAFADIEAVIDDVEVGQHYTLGEAGSAGGVLHVNGFMAIKGRLDRIQFLIADLFAKFDDLLD